MRSKLSDLLDNLSEIIKIAKHAWGEKSNQNVNLQGLKIID